MDNEHVSESSDFDSEAAEAAEDGEDGVDSEDEEYNSDEEPEGIIASVDRVCRKLACALREAELNLATEDFDKPYHAIYNVLKARPCIGTLVDCLVEFVEAGIWAKEALQRFHNRPRTVTELHVHMYHITEAHNGLPRLWLVLDAYMHCLDHAQVRDLGEHPGHEDDDEANDAWPVIGPASVVRMREIRTTSESSQRSGRRETSSVVNGQFVRDSLRNLQESVTNALHRVGVETPVARIPEPRIVFLQSPDAMVL